MIRHKGGVPKVVSLGFQSLRIDFGIVLPCKALVPGTKTWYRYDTC